MECNRLNVKDKRRLVRNFPVPGEAALELWGGFAEPALCIVGITAVDVVGSRLEDFLDTPLGDPARITADIIIRWGNMSRAIANAAK